jgi:hypothetical protein
MMGVVDKFLELQQAFGDTLATTGRSIDELAREMLPTSVTAWLVMCGGSAPRASERCSVSLSMAATLLTSLLSTCCGARH